MIFFLAFISPIKEYTIIDIKETQLNYYVILVKEKKTKKLYCFETMATEINNQKKIKIGDVVSLKLVKNKSKAIFKLSKKIPSFDSLNIYDDSLKVHKNYHCKELNGLTLKMHPKLPHA